MRLAVGAQGVPWLQRLATNRGGQLRGGDGETNYHCTCAQGRHSTQVANEKIHLHLLTKLTGPHPVLVNAGGIRKTNKNDEQLTTTTSFLDTCCVPYDAVLFPEQVSEFLAQRPTHVRGSFSLRLYLDSRLPQ